MISILPGPSVIYRQVTRAERKFVGPVRDVLSSVPPRRYRCVRWIASLLPLLPAPLTPMMAQYFELKSKAGDCLLFYRMGDFFELFFDDAKAAAATLDIALTSRGEHDGAPIPMCGVPVHSAEGYLARLIRAGHRVAIAEQTENPCGGEGARWIQGARRARYRPLCDRGHADGRHVARCAGRQHSGRHRRGCGRDRNRGGRTSPQGGSRRCVWTRALSMGSWRGWARARSC
jgi:uncharacterized protein YdbL (DUF1318 family)